MSSMRKVRSGMEQVIGALRAKAGEERGAVIALVAVSLAVLLGMGGLALDAGRGYLAKAEFARALDAAALAGARSLREGQGIAQQRAFAVAAMNGLVDGQNGVDIDISFGLNEFGEQTISMQANRSLPTMLINVLGRDSLTVRSGAVAAVPPVDLVLVLDQSGSLDRNDAWDDLQDAAKEFVGQFNDDIDQLALVSFQLRGTERFALSGGFTSTIRNKIDAMQSNGDTNAGEGLRMARDQLLSVAARDRSAKVVVFFTDGRPTAFRGNLGGQDRALAVFTTNTSVVRGYFNNPDNLPTDQPASPSGCSSQSSCFGMGSWDVRNAARQSGLDRAEQLRDDGFIVYSIGLGDPDADEDLEIPDMDYLRAIANEEGVSSSGQPKGKAYFAPDEAELRSVFNKVAQDLLVRLAQ